MNAAACDIANLLEQVGAQPPRHGRGKWVCPECGRPDLSVNLERQVFHCFHAGCSFAGGAGTLRRRLGIECQWLPHYEYVRLRREREQADEKARALLEQKQAEARRLAEQIWAEAIPAPDTHPYLLRKGVTSHGLRLSAGQLLIPVLDVEGVLHSLQLISPAGDKTFLFGGRVRGCAYGIGKLGSRVFLTEGYATGATIFETTGEAVAVCFFAGNFYHVAEALRAKYQKAELIIAADNDREKPDNPGLTAAKATARRFGLKAVWPTFPQGKAGSDFNDLALEIGVDAVREELQSITAAPASDDFLRA